MNLYSIFFFQPQDGACAPKLHLCFGPPLSHTHTHTFMALALKTITKEIPQMKRAH